MRCQRATDNLLKANNGVKGTFCCLLRPSFIITQNRIVIIHKIRCPHQLTAYLAGLVYKLLIYFSARTKSEALLGPFPSPTPHQLPPLTTFQPFPIPPCFPPPTNLLDLTLLHHRGFKPNIFQLGPFFYPSTSNPQNFFWYELDPKLKLF